jgi:hypothetical protein
MKLKTLLATAIAIATGAAPAAAQALSYAGWAGLPGNERALYIAGAFDQFVTIYAPPDLDGSGFQDFVLHLGACVADRGLAAFDLQNGLLAFAIGRPDLQAGPIPIILMEYLIAECGLPPDG